jgi:protein phosphatase PTC7
LHLVFGACGIPHPEKAAKGGEDAFFYDDRSGSFGVADGVGGSASDGVDPGLYSRKMLECCCKAAASSGGDNGGVREALKVAAREQLGIGGSSTLLLGQLENGPGASALRILNLGDSGALLLRPAPRRFQKGNLLWPRVVLRSVDQTHYFNCPYQASADDFGGIASHVDEISTSVREGDILVAATDGVLDNLFDEQIQLAIAQHLGELRAADASAVQEAIDALAARLAKEANAVGLRQDEKGLRTPFAVAAAQEGYRLDGGKLDDVAVVCGLVRSGERPPPRSLHNFEMNKALDGVVTPSASGVAAPV